jgi:hypothetical protein
MRKHAHTLALALAAVAPLQAAERALPEPGARVRVITVAAGDTGPVGRGPQIGRLLSIDPEGLRLAVGGGRKKLVTIELDRIASLEVARGGSRTRRAAIGAGVGAAVGGVAGLGSGDDPYSYVRLTAVQKGLILGAAAACLGGVLGALTHRTRWERVGGGPEIELRLGPATGGGVGAAVRLGF